jgi:hypothetical protein
VVGDLGGWGVLVLLAGLAAVWWPALLGPLARWSVWVGSVLVVVGFAAVAPAFSREWRPPSAAAAVGAAAAPLVVARSVPTATPTAVVVVPSPTAAPLAGAFAPRGVAHAVDGAIGGTGQVNRYEFRAQRGQLLEARVKRASGSGLYGALALVAPSGAEEKSASSNDRGEAFLEVRQLGGAGAYTLAVSGVDGTTGPYTLTWTLDRFGRLVDGAGVDAELTRWWCLVSGVRWGRTP